MVWDSAYPATSPQSPKDSPTCLAMSAVCLCPGLCGTLFLDHTVAEASSLDTFRSNLDFNCHLLTHMDELVNIPGLPCHPLFLPTPIPHCPLLPPPIYLTMRCVLNCSHQRQICSQEHLLLTVGLGYGNLFITSLLHRWISSLSS